MEFGIKKLLEKKERRKPLKREKASRNQILQQEYHQRNGQKSRPPCKILGTILTVNKGGTRRNVPKDKKINDYAQGLTPER